MADKDISVLIRLRTMLDAAGLKQQVGVINSILQNQNRKTVSDFRTKTGLAGGGIANFIPNQFIRDSLGLLTPQQMSVARSNLRQTLNFAKQNLGEWRNITRQFETGKYGSLPTGRQQFGAAWEQSGGGYGKYVLAGLLGGRAGIGGLALGSWGKNFQQAYKSQLLPGQINLWGNVLGGGARVLGAGALAAGTMYMAGRATYGLTTGIGDIFGLNQQGMQSFIEFDKATRLTALNLRAAGYLQDTKSLNEGIKKIGDTAKNLSITYGAAGTPTDFGNLMRAAAGMGGVSPQNIGVLAGIASQLSMISEQTTPEQAVRGIISISNAAKAAGIKNLGYKDIASSMYIAGAQSPAMVSDIVANSSRIAQMMSSGASLSEALTSYMFLTGVGYTPARAATQMASLRVRNPSVLLTKGFDKILGIDRSTLLNMTPMQFLSKLMTKAGKEGLATQYGIQGGENPLLQRKIVNDIDAILSKTWGLRGGEFMSLLSNKMSTEEGRQELDKWMNSIADAAQSTERFDFAVKEINQSLGGRMANAQNAFGLLQMEAQGAFFPFLGNLAERFTIQSTKFRMQQAKDFNPNSEEYQAILSREKELESLDNILKSITGQLPKDSPFVAVAEFGYKLAKTLEPLVKTPDALKNTIESLINIFTTLGGVLLSFGDALVTIIGALGGEGSKAKSYLYTQAKNAGFNTPEALSIYRLSDQEAIQKRKSYEEYVHKPAALESLTFGLAGFDPAKNMQTRQLEWFKNNNLIVDNTKTTNTLIGTMISEQRTTNTILLGKAFGYSNPYTNVGSTTSSGDAYKNPKNIAYQGYQNPYQ